MMRDEAAEDTRFDQRVESGCDFSVFRVCSKFDVFVLT